MGDSGLSALTSRMCSQGDTIEGSLEMIRDAIAGHLGVVEEKRRRLVQ